MNRLLGAGRFPLALVVLLMITSPWPTGESEAPAAALSPTSTTAPAPTTTELPAPTTPDVHGDVLPANLPTTTSAPTSVPTALPGPRILIAVGAPTDSARCESPSCHWIDARLSGFPPNTQVEVVAIGNGRDFSEPCVTTTDANGTALCDDTRYDVPGAEVHAYVDIGNSRITSNTLVWPKA